MRRSEPGAPVADATHSPPSPRANAIERPSGDHVGPGVARPGADDADELRGRRRVDRDVARGAVDGRPRHRHQAAVGRDGGIPQLVPGVGGHQALAGEVGVGHQQADLLLERRLVGGVVAQQAAAEPVGRDRRARATVSRPLPSARARNRYGIACGVGGPPGKGVIVSMIVSIVAICPPSGLMCVTSTAPAAVRVRARHPPALGVEHVGLVAVGHAEARAVARRRQPRVDRAGLGAVARELGLAGAVGRDAAEVREAAIEDRVRARRRRRGRARTAATRAARAMPVITRGRRRAGSAHSAAISHQ